MGITWFEAKAYCAWLSAQTGDKVELPTEVEWEAAAKGKDIRQYAYGAEFDTVRCNTFETHIRRMTPIGVFPDGCTAEGIFDLSGNVWEWTSTIWGQASQNADFSYPYDDKDGRENQEDGASRRVVRGGSWDNNQATRAQPVVTTTIRRYASTTTGFGWCVVPHLTSTDHYSGGTQR